LTCEWVVVHTHNRAEWQANRALKDAGFVTLYLHYLATVKHARKVIAVNKPLFPRYLFVAVEPHQNFHDINVAQGVSTVLHDADGPLPLREADIVRLRAGADENGLMASPKAVPDREKYKHGEKLRIIDGPLKGWDAVVILDNFEVIRVTVEMFKGELEAVLSPTAVKRAFTLSA